MKSFKVNSLRTLAIATAIGALTITATTLASVRSEIVSAAQMVGAGAVTEISFRTGVNRLPSKAKNELAQFMADSMKKGEIREIQVLAWSDKEYPARGVSQTKTQLALAEQRADDIESYIKSKFDVSDVKIKKMNMGERPNALQNTVQTDTAKTKNSMEQTGAAPTQPDQIGIFGANGKSSHAIVLVFYKSTD